MFDINKVDRDIEFFIFDILLIKTDYLNINDQHTKSLLSDIEEIVKLLISIVKSTQRNI